MLGLEGAPLCLAFLSLSQNNINSLGWRLTPWAWPVWLSWLSPSNHILSSRHGALGQGIASEPTGLKFEIPLPQLPQGHNSSYVSPHSGHIQSFVNLHTVGW